MKSVKPFEQMNGTDSGATRHKKAVSVGLDVLDASQVLAIDRAVRQVGEYGEIHLIVRRGQVRFIGTLKTEALDKLEGLESES
jgi:hypothetical protein